MLAEGKLHGLLKWLANYQETAVSSRAACLAAGSAGHGAQQLAPHNAPLLQLRCLDKASKMP